MLDRLITNYDQDRIHLTQDFKHDLREFSKFLKEYNGISIYDHSPVHHTIELEACLSGLGGRWENFVYFLAIPKNYQNLTIVHLEMVNIILALRVFGPMWKGKKITIKCDNDAVVKVLSHGRARDPFRLLVPGMRGTLQLMLILTHHMSMGKNNQSLTVI